MKTIFSAELCAVPGSGQHDIFICLFIVSCSSTSCDSIYAQACLIVIVGQSNDIVAFDKHTSIKLKHFLMSFHHTKWFCYCLFSFFLFWFREMFWVTSLPPFDWWGIKGRSSRRIQNANKNSISQFDFRLWLSFRYFNSFHCSQILILFSSSIIIRMLSIHCHCFTFSMCIAIEAHKGPFTSRFFPSSFVTRALR